MMRLAGQAKKKKHEEAVVTKQKTTGGTYGQRYHTHTHAKSCAVGGVLPGHQQSVEHSGLNRRQGGGEGYRHESGGNSSRLSH